ncbi:RHS repeat-associated core domain-containing protein, partial [Stenotrophomonas maltophilia group sp. RNC7]|uniref:RHS repeat-associated core domain-containing protein n=1 Tax=Stenotrophomonas maltophilia group sp. RNC7 TaxID=3071467 RepID=UPI0027DF4CB4
NVVYIVTEAGDIENQYDYDIFGNPILTVEAYSNAIRYAGEFYDEETGLYYLRARYYNPYIGRFISEDSYWGEDTNPLSLNLYVYCYNDPIKFVDPTGHWGILSSITKAVTSAVTSVIKSIGSSGSSSSSKSSSSSSSSKSSSSSNIAIGSYGSSSSKSNTSIGSTVGTTIGGILGGVAGSVVGNTIGSVIDRINGSIN